MMKFQENDILYYVCPFQFSIELIKVVMAVKEGNYLYYIDEVGSYLKEENLFTNVYDARENAHKKLSNFYYKKSYEIIHIVPQK